MVGQDSLIWSHCLGEPPEILVLVLVRFRSTTLRWRSRSRSRCSRKRRAAPKRRSAKPPSRSSAWPPVRASTRNTRLRLFDRYSQFIRIGHVPGGGRPLLREGGPISYEATPSAFFLPRSAPLLCLASAPPSLKYRDRRMVRSREEKRCSILRPTQSRISPSIL